MGIYSVVSANRRKFLETVYNEGEMSVREIAEKSGMTRSSIYNIINNDLTHVLTSRGDIVGDKRQSFYGLKENYRIGIGLCLEEGIDILDIISHKPKE